MENLVNEDYLTLIALKTIQVYMGDSLFKPLNNFVYVVIGLFNFFRENFWFLFGSIFLKFIFNRNNSRLIHTCR